MGHNRRKRTSATQQCCWSSPARVRERRKRRGVMEEREDEAISALLNPLLRALEMLTFIARHLHPPDFAELMASIGAHDDDLKSARARQPPWPERLSGIKTALDAASGAALESFSGLREALTEEGDIRRVYRALRFLPKGLEALYPLAGILTPVNRFFLDPALRP